MRRAAPRHAGVSGSCGSAVFALGGLIAAAVYAMDISSIWSTTAFAVVGIGTVIALVVGPRWYYAEPRRPWTLLSVASAVFLIGALVRPWSTAKVGVAAFAADLFTVPGYLLAIFGIAGLLWARGGLERHAVIDGLIVCVGAALISVLLLALPAVAIPHRAVAVSVMAGVYPLFDVVVLLLLVNLAFTTAARQPSYLMLVSMMTLLLIGDLAYAIIGVSGDLTGSHELDLPFLLGFTMIGAAALHPSMAELGRATALPVQAWSWQRLLLIVPAVAAPFVLTATVDNGSWSHRLVLAVGGATIVTLLLVRAVSAVQGYAAAQRRYEHQATHDQLTGLPNRSMFSTEVERLLATGTPRGMLIWVFFLDLDGFKLVNDSWGHAAGDQLIAEVAQRLRMVVPAKATVARVGGDEFVVVYRCTWADMEMLAESILDCFGEPLQLTTAEVVVSASVGIAGTSMDEAAGATAEGLMRDADTAMYQAKSEGPGKWTLFDMSMHERVRERVDLELALRQAVSQEELRLVYQPIVELRSGRILGAETLARWDHPLRGAISPEAFIPIAEDTGLISRIGRWVLDESLPQLAQWRDDGVVAEDFWLSVNVSPRQLRDPLFPIAVSESLQRHNVPGHAVVLEITESVMIDPSAVTDHVLRELRALGVRIVVDDFGTGYSALGYLHRHPVTGVKVDRAFVRGLGANPRDEEIVRAVVAMSSALSLTVVAEGVETVTQQVVLASLGVTLGQGRLWGAPVAPNEFGRQWSALVAASGGAAHPDSGSYSQ